LALADIGIDGCAGWLAPPLIHGEYSKPSIQGDEGWPPPAEEVTRASLERVTVPVEAAVDFFFGCGALGADCQGMSLAAALVDAPLPRAVLFFLLRFATYSSPNLPPTALSMTAVSNNRFHYLQTNHLVLSRNDHSS
jgi:hypothetical protein